MPTYNKALVSLSGGLSWIAIGSFGGNSRRITAELGDELGRMKIPVDPLDWQPLTPISLFIPLVTTLPSLPHFDALPPAHLVGAPITLDTATRSALSHSHLNRATPTQGYFLPSSSSSGIDSVVDREIESCGAMSIDYLVIPRERPRREASRLAAQAIATPRQPSPFDLPPPPRPSASHSRTSASGSRKAVSLETSVGSSRKVSHSLIERRRREKINECLSTLRRLVPYCREEGERKEARAKERGRKRGSRMVVDDDGEQSRGGLHKLEILQGTVLYIQELQAQLEATSPTPSSTVPSASSSTSPRSDAALSSPVSLWMLPPSTQQSLAVPAPTMRRLAPPIGEKELKGMASNGNAETDAARLLLRLSASPQLRPVVFH